MANYNNEIERTLKNHSIKIGQKVSIEKDGKTYEGFVMPGNNPDNLVLKLDSGYNIGIEFNGANIKKLEGKRELKKPPTKIKKHKPDPDKPTIAILHTGGTVASRIDYETGAVTPALTAEELFVLVPEIENIANIRLHVFSQMFSEDIEPKHWENLAEKAKEEVETGADGVIITHGTDTMHYTSAALSFALKNLAVPVLLVGSQRSSDRGSSDAAMNLLCASYFIAKSDFSGVGICMHGSMDDEYCLIHNPVNVRKMHTSRRDTFQSIDVLPYAKVHKDGEIEFLRDYTKKHNEKLTLKNKFKKNVAIVRTYPGFSHEELELYTNYKGIIIEGTGMGHAPITATDEITSEHTKLLEKIAEMTKKDIVIVLTSQCPYGRINANVYSAGRKLQQAGVLPIAMTTETAFVKLCWALGQAKYINEVKKLMQTNIAGEIVNKIDPRAFLFYKNG